MGPQWQDYRVGTSRSFLAQPPQGSNHFQASGPPKRNSVRTGKRTGKRTNAGSHLSISGIHLRSTFMTLRTNSRSAGREFLARSREFMRGQHRGLTTWTILPLRSAPSLRPRQTDLPTLRQRLCLGAMCRACRRHSTKSTQLATLAGMGNSLKIGFSLPNSPILASQIRQSKSGLRLESGWGVEG